MERERERNSDPLLLPWASLMVQGMGLGLRWDDLCSMPVQMLLALIEAHVDEQEKARKAASGTRPDGEVRDATQADIDAFI